MLKLKHRLYLQAFAEGLDGAEGMGDSEGSTDSGFADQTDADGDLFGYSEEASTVSQDEGGHNDGDDYQAFREKYRDRIGEEIQSAIQRRFKNQQSYEDSYNALVESMSPLFIKYGLDGSDIEGLKNALAQDDSLLEDKAYDEGLTPEAMRKQLNMQREIERLKEEQIQAQASRDAYEQYQGWKKEAEELKAIYPNFDLVAELENEDFRNDLVNSGKPLRKVFEAAHLEEIIAGAIQTTAAKSREATINDIKARGMRPQENGTRMGSVSVKKNVDDLTDKDIDRIIERVRRGDVISF